MNNFINQNRSRLSDRWNRAGLLIAAALAAALPWPSAAQTGGSGEEIRILYPLAALHDGSTLQRVRRQIAIAAGRLCDKGDIATIYRNGRRRCSEQAIANAERQLQARLGTRIAARATR